MRSGVVPGAMALFYQDGSGGGAGGTAGNAAVGNAAAAAAAAAKPTATVLKCPVY